MDTRTVYIHRNLSYNEYLDIWVVNPKEPNSAEIHTIFTNRLSDTFAFIKQHIGSDVVIKNMLQ